MSSAKGMMALLAASAEAECTSRRIVLSDWMNRGLSVIGPLDEQPVRKDYCRHRLDNHDGPWHYARIVPALDRDGDIISFPVDGMLTFENMVADYVKETGNHVLYRVTPIFTGDNLVADGVEMEALTGVSVTLLTIYDMCKAIDKGMVIENIHLVSKSGGKSGDFVFGQKTL